MHIKPIDITCIIQLILALPHAQKTHPQGKAYSQEARSHIGRGAERTEVVGVPSYSTHWMGPNTTPTCDTPTSSASSRPVTFASELGLRGETWWPQAESRELGGEWIYVDALYMNM